MTLQIKDGFRTELSVGDLLESFFTSLESSEKKSDGELQSILKFSTQLENSVRNLEELQPGLGADLLRKVRNYQSSDFGHKDMGATMAYLSKKAQIKSSISNLRSLLCSLLESVHTVKINHSLQGIAYRLFLAYLQNFPHKEVQDHVNEFKAVVLNAALPAFRQGYKRVARLKEVEGSWDGYINFVGSDKMRVQIAKSYKELEEKYNLKVSNVEDFIDSYLRENAYSDKL